MLDDAGPLAEQLVPAPVVAALESAVPGCVALEAPYELTRTALDLQSRGRGEGTGTGTGTGENIYSEFISILDHSRLISDQSEDLSRT